MEKELKQFDLFGNEVIPESILNGPSYAGKMIDRLHNAFGTLPGEKCKNCIHFLRFKQSVTWFKCGLSNYGSSPASDIRANDTACGRFEKEPEK